MVVQNVVLAVEVLGNYIAGISDAGTKKGGKDLISEKWVRQFHICLQEVLKLELSYYFAGVDLTYLKTEVYSGKEQNVIQLTKKLHLKIELKMNQLNTYVVEV